MAKRAVYIDNDEFYRTYPFAHEFALQAFPEVTEENYPAVEGWMVMVDEEGEYAGEVLSPLWAQWYLAK